MEMTRIMTAGRGHREKPGFHGRILLSETTRGLEKPNRVLGRGDGRIASTGPSSMVGSWVERLKLSCLGLEESADRFNDDDDVCGGRMLRRATSLEYTRDSEGEETAKQAVYGGFERTMGFHTPGEIMQSGGFATPAISSQYSKAATGLKRADSATSPE